MEYELNNLNQNLSNRIEEADVFSRKFGTFTNSNDIVYCDGAVDSINEIIGLDGE